MSEAAIWHDVECGAYTADLGLWGELASQAAGPVLDLGCGTGRVALHLARRGSSVVGIDIDPELIAALSERSSGLPLAAAVADATAFELDTDIALALAPMQLIQLLAGSEERLACQRTIAAHLTPGGRVALAIVERMPAPDGETPLLPDVREIDGWVYSSLPLAADAEGEEIVVRRLRQTVSPAGALSEEENEIRLRALSAEQLESEAVAAGLHPGGRREIAATDLHVGSTVVVLERPA